MRDFTRREVLWGTGGLIALTVVGVGAERGWISLPARGHSHLQAAQQMVQKGGGYQTPEGDILGDLYLTCQFAMAAVCAGFTPPTVRNATGRSVYEYFA